ncbi:MAG TPA: T9SS type A sorting domain-containing protein [Chitinophagaceae bacterium]|nr:T9SS type A sorting domain-containing protein [Chitinophagaceae bacterium]
MQHSRVLFFIFCATLLLQCKNDRENDLEKKEMAEERMEQDGMEQAMHQIFMQTRDPVLNIVPTQRLEIARAYMQTFIGGAGTAPRPLALSWTERGPDNVGGRTRALMIDKRDASGNTVLAGSVGGGIFISKNFTSGSATWSPVNDQLQNLAITNLIQDPVNMNIMYATTGEGWFNADFILGQGIFKSTDGGTTWTQLPSTVDMQFIQDICIDTNGNLYVVLRNQGTNITSRGVQRSTDGGVSWTQVVGAPLPGFDVGRSSDLEVASNGDIYACQGIFNTGLVWKSSFAANGVNTGALNTWVNITPTRTTICHRLKIAIAPSNPQRLYLLMQDSATSQVSAIYRSSNGGNTWDSLAAPGALNNGANSQCWYNLASAVDPNNADVLVVGGLNLAKSTNAGDSWTTITTSGTVHVDHHIVLYNGSSKLLNGNDGGIYYSDNIDQPNPLFTMKNTGYNVTQYYGCDVHPTNVNYFLAGAQDNGTQEFTTAGINSTVNATGGDGGFCHIDQTNGLLQITSNTNNRYNFSTNGGSTFSPVPGANARGQFINPTDFDDISDVLYCGDDPGRYFFITNWSATPVGTPALVSNIGSQEVTAVKVDPLNINTIWLGASFGGLRAQILRLTNANTAFPTVTVAAFLGTTSGLNNTVNANVSSITVDNVNSSHIIATLSNYGVISVWESTNGGVSFTAIEGNLPDMPIHWAMFVPTNAQLNGSGGGNGGVMLGTELGVWTTSLLNGSSTVWAPNNIGFPNVSTHMLKLRASDNMVAAATHGRGLFTTVLPTVVTGVPDNNITKDFIKYISAENGQLQIVAGTLQTHTMTMQLFDMGGRLVHQQNGRYQNSTIDLRRLQSGAYAIRIKGDKNENFVQQFIKK